jgi:hypothetical protein
VPRFSPNFRADFFMIKAIGFRVEAKTVHYAIVGGTKLVPTLFYHDKMTPPSSYDKECCQLAWYRDRLFNIIVEYQPKLGAIRFPEPCSYASANIDSLLKRARIEGVILEFLWGQNVECIGAAFKTISSELNCKKAKDCLKHENFRTLDWSEIKNQNRRESILVAITQLVEN